MVRYIAGVALGALTTFLLFFLMQSLIQTEKSALDDTIKGRLVDFVRVEEDIDVQTKVRKPTPPPPPEEPPPDAPTPQFDSAATSFGVDVSAVNVNVDLNVGGVGGFSSDGEYLPIVKVAPVYPRRAQTRGIEGFVLLEFVVTAAGSVRDPVVIESSPPGIFDNAAIQAALKFKYKPKVVNGQAIDVAGVRNRIVFELAD
jgi:protein TonB